MIGLYQFCKLIKVIEKMFVAVCHKVLKMTLDIQFSSGTLITEASADKSHQHAYYKFEALLNAES